MWPRLVGRFSTSSMLVEWMNADWWMCSSNEWQMEMNVRIIFDRTCVNL